MIETMYERLGKILDECPQIYAFNLSVKCKTQDGMICTLAEIRVTMDDVPGGCHLNDIASSEATKAVLHEMELAESEKFLYSDVENVVIRADCITRIWTELDYSDCAPIPAKE